MKNELSKSWLFSDQGEKGLIIAEQAENSDILNTEKEL